MGTNREELAFDGPVTVRAVLQRLVDIHGEEMTQIFYNQYGWLDPRLFFLIDREEGVVRRDLDAQLRNGEEITLVLGIPMTGG